MAFRNLTDADCGGSNPIVQFSSHLTKDHTLRETHGYPPFGSESDQLVEQFLQETRTVPQTFQMDGLLQEMRDIESQRFTLPPVPASKVKDHLNDDTWALQYIQDGKTFDQAPNHEEIWSQAETELHDNEYTNEFGLGDNWAENYLIDEISEEISDEAKEVQATANQLVNTVNDPKFAYSKFMKFMNKVGEGSVIIEDGNVIEKESVAEQSNTEWVDEFTHKDDKVFHEEWAKIQSTSGEEKEQWEKYVDEWKKISNPVLSEHPWLDEFNTSTNPYKDYAFTDENPMKGLSNALEVGKEHLMKGDLPSAVLCFEAAVKQEPENSEAWQLLGTTQAENEQDPQAICALKRCLEIEPTNLKAILSLAVCYTNENYHSLACQTLVDWLKINSKYSDLVPENYTCDISMPAFISQAQHKEVENMFIKAVQRNINEIDYEVQCCLGILFNISGEYDKAIDCLQTALQIKPDDSRLWNRLGATFANASRSEEAVEAYHRALSLCPGFIRARYNVGITCINLKVFKEAAEHLLIALNQQALGRDVSKMTSTNQMSETIWSTLRMCLGLMNKPELTDLCDKRDLKELNKAFEMTDYY